jgi:putative endonuclease
VEVKYRSTGRQGEAVEAVGKTKQQIISRVAAYYLLKRVHSLEIPCRFDVIAIDGDLIRWIPDAFAYCP